MNLLAADGRLGHRQAAEGLTCGATSRHLVVYSGIIATFFAALTRRDRREQLKFGGLVWLGMAGGVLLLAYV